MRDALRACVAVLLSLCVCAMAQAADYVQQPGSMLTFAGKYQGEVFTGRFPGFVAKISFDPAALATSRIDVVIPLVNATTDNAEYDTELRGGAFFDAGRYAQARYIATTFRRLPDGRYAADGVLSLRGISKPVTLTFTWTPGPIATLTGQASVRRLQFGVGGGDWADTTLIPDAIAIATKVLLKPAGK